MGDPGAGPDRRVAVLADAHLHGPGGEAAPLLAQLRELPAGGATRLVLLGDLFQAWVGFPQFAPPDLSALLAVVGRS